MQTLPATAVLHALHALRNRALPAEFVAPDDFDRLERLARALGDPGHSLSVAAALALLFAHVANHATATRHLSELVRRFNTAAEAAGSGHRLNLAGGKRAGAAGRRLSFSGPTLLSGQAQLPDLAGMAGQPLLPQRGRPARPLVLITVNRHEGDAVLDAFLGDSAPQQIDRGGLVYDRLGVHGGFDVWHTTTEMGAVGPGATLVRVGEIIATLKPVAVLAVGIAFGVDPSRQPIGQVLVSEKLQAYELQRIGTHKRILRGDRATPSTRWLQRARAVDGKWRRHDAAAWPPVQFGLLLSGEKLIDDLDYRDQLREQAGGEAIGGEMEGAGLYAATHARKIDWLVIKAVCDYADGNKGQDKQARQRHAARCAAQVARAVVDIDWNPAARPLPPDLCHTMGSDDLDRAGPLVRARGRRISLNKSLLAEPAAASTTGDGVDIQRYLLDWLRQADATPLFALLGEYGMGKTIACQQLVRTVDAMRRTDPSLPVPLYFDLRKLTGLRERVPLLDEVLQECIARGWQRSAAPAPSVAQVHALVRDRALVVFDGLDEALVHLRKADGQTFTQELLSILPKDGDDDRNKRQRSRLLISCRTHYFRNLRDQHTHFTGQERGQRTARDFDALVLLPFDDTQIEQYLREVLPERDIAEVMATIAAVHDLGDLAPRPYTLRLIAELLPQIETLRAQGQRVYGVTLYREMVLRWLERDEGKHHLNPDHKRRLSAHLAGELWRRGQRIVPAEELESWFQHWLGTQPDIARRYAGMHPDWLDEDLRTATFFVREDGATPSASGFRFAHSSLQEYFLAEHLDQAVREDAPAAWALPLPSPETLRFLGQLIAERDDPADLQRLRRWSRHYRAQASELLLLYADLARQADPPLPCPDLAGMDLSGAQLADCRLGSEDERIPPWELGALRLAGADLRRARIYRLQLDGADLSGAQLSHAEWLGGNARGCWFVGADLCATLFRDLDLAGADWSGAEAHHAKFLLCSFAPDGFATAGLAPDSRRERLTTDREFEHWHRGRISACAWSPDGQRLLSASEDGTLRLWDAASGQLLFCLRGHTDGITACAWSPDGRQLLSASWDDTLRLWDAASGQPVLCLRGPENRITACVWSPDGRHLLSDSWDNTLRLWDAASGQSLLCLSGHTDTVTACAWSPDGRHLLSASQDRTLRIWDATSGQPLFCLHGHESWVTACAWSPDGRHLLSASDDGTLRLWDASSRRALLCMRGHNDAVTACAWSPNGHQLLSASSDNTVRVWDATTGQVLLCLRGHDHRVTACCWSPNGRHLLCAYWDNTLRLWDAASGQSLHCLRGHTETVTACAWSPGERHLLSASQDRTLRLWDANSGQSLLCLRGHENGITACAWSPDGRHLLSASRDRTLRLWDANSGQSLLCLGGHDETVTACAWSPDGHRLLSASQDRTLRLWHATTGQVLLCLRGHDDRVAACAWSPDGRQLVSASWDNTLRLWDATSGQSLLCLRGHDDRVTACAWSPHGHQLLSTSDDLSLRLWDVASGQPLLCLRGHEKVITACAWSPDGRHLLSASADGTLRIWNASTGTELYRVLHTLHGHALIRDGGIAAIGGEAWRDVGWQVDDGHGGYEILPAETFGALPDRLEPPLTL